MKNIGKLSKNFKQKATRGIIFIIIFSSSFALSFFSNNTHALGIDSMAADGDSISSGENQVFITARVNFNPTLKVYPEKRIPAVNHWVNTNVIEIRPVGSRVPLVTQVVPCDENGICILNPIDVGALPSGNYDVAVKGFSHLRKVFPNKSFIANSLFLDLTSGGQELLAGDTSVIEDNYVNSLDLDSTIQYLYSFTNIKNDLNRDTQVNSLDLSNEIINLYKSGDN